MSLKVTSVQMSKHCCFSDWAGLNDHHPITVLVGKNNSGKSRLLDLVDCLCNGTLTSDIKSWNIKCEAKLDRQTLEESFPRGDHQLLPLDYRRVESLVDTPITWQLERGGKSRLLTDPQSLLSRLPIPPPDAAEFSRTLLSLTRQATLPYSDKVYRALSADRDIQPEIPGDGRTLHPNGFGATSMIRKHLRSASKPFHSDNVQRLLLNALNKIFEPDGSFIDIEVKELDSGQAVASSTLNEIYLREERKGYVALSQSGSGLKTVLLVLLNVILVPIAEGRELKDFVFSFEELENNLHPSLLRRLLSFIEATAISDGATIFLTTHSSTTVDFFGQSSSAQVVRVEHDGAQSRIERLDGYFHRLKSIRELGARPSDLLQANGIIWVEGPSDRIYVNRWIDIYSGGKYVEGRHYQCAFYGGSLLGRVEFRAPDEEFTEFVNLLAINPNVFVLCDSDRRNLKSTLKERVRKVRAQLDGHTSGGIWITKAREIENYLPAKALQAYVGAKSRILDPEPYELVVPTGDIRGRERSYLEKHMKRRFFDKVDLALRTCRHVELADMQSRHDWATGMSHLIGLIERWNR